MQTNQFTILEAVQPYLLQNTARYYRYPVCQHGIQEFYSFETYPAENEKQKAIECRFVPEVAEQLMIACTENGYSFLFLGPDQYPEMISLKPETVYFGVRFVPGVLHLAERFSGDRKVREKITALLNEEESFIRRCRIFKQIFEDYLKDCDERTDNSQVPSIYAIISSTNGDIRVDELSRNLGYSARYMNKMVKNGFGTSPKTLCKYLRFQKSLDYLGRRNDMDITEISSVLGYYDQSHFVKYFKEYTGQTPRSYVAMIRNGHLYQKIESVSRDDKRNAEGYTQREWRNLFLAE